MCDKDHPEAVASKGWSLSLGQWLFVLSCQCLWPCKSTLKSLPWQDTENGSAGKAFSAQTWDLEFRLQHPCKKLLGSIWLQFRSSEAGTGRCLGHVCYCWPQARLNSYSLAMIDWLKLYGCWLGSPLFLSLQPLLTVILWVCELPRGYFIEMWFVQHWPHCNGILPFNVDSGWGIP